MRGRDSSGCERNERSGDRSVVGHEDSASTGDDEPKLRLANCPSVDLVDGSAIARCPSGRSVDWGAASPRIAEVPARELQNLSLCQLLQIVLHLRLDVGKLRWNRRLGAFHADARRRAPDSAAADRTAPRLVRVV